MGFFGGKKSGGAEQTAEGRIARHSSGWSQMGKYLKARESLRILDFGPTSAGNINYVTELGHSIYMANLIDEATRETLQAELADETRSEAAISRFLLENLDFSGRQFDVVLLWDTADYLPESLLQPVIHRLAQVLVQDGQLLAFFHAKTTSDETVFSRYHLTHSEAIDIQKIGGHALLHTYNNRQVENLFSDFGGYKFFLAKDTMREVIVTR